MNTYTLVPSGFHDWNGWWAQAKDGSKTSYCPGKQGAYSSKTPLLSGNIGTPGPATACKAKTDPTPWFYLWFLTNKTRSSSSAKYTRDQQILEHGNAITLHSVPHGDIHTASPFHGGGFQANSPSDFANRGLELGGRLAPESQEAPPAACSKTTSSSTWESRPCRTWSSLGLVKTLAS